MAETSNADSSVAYVSLGTAAKKLGVSTYAIRRWCDDGDLKFWRTPGGQRRILLSDLDDLINRGAA